jgi:DNA-binding response OmpR family regulator
MKRTCVLIVDDERRYRALLEIHLSRAGYAVAMAQSGTSALHSAEREDPDVILLDVRLPDMDGYTVCRRLREYSEVPIIMLSVNSEEAEKVLGLRSGADDYVTKPFDTDELIARIEAVLRRSRNCTRRSGLQQYRNRQLEIDLWERRVTVGSQAIDLTAGEFRLLEQLALNAGRVVMQEELLRGVWGTGYEGDADLLHTTVRRLRRKLGDDPRAPRWVLTKRGLGYSLVSPE